MKLFAVHDDPKGHVYFEERVWMAIWADDVETAEKIFVENYEYNQDPVEPSVTRSIDLPEFEPDEPGEEHQPHVLRRAGMHEEGEEWCAECHLASMGIPEYAVCHECYLCKECGCVCNADG